MNGFCEIADKTGRLVVVTFSCLTVEGLVMTIVDRYPAIEGLELLETMPDSGLAVVLQAR
jgi:hypothetical protein